MAKSKGKSKTKSQIPESILNAGKWEKVKIKGKVISDEDSNFDGLIGLEVLNEYAPGILSKGNQKIRTEKKDKSTAKVETKSKTKPKKNKALKSENNNVQAGRYVLLHQPKNDDDEDDDDEPLTLTVDSLEGWNGLGVPQPILRALAECGFKSPTEIQTKVLPAAIFGKKDILGAAETGSGKTLAFAIPILAGIMELKSRKIHMGIRKAPQIHIETTEDSKNPKRQKLDTEHELTPPPEELALPSHHFDEDNDEDELKEMKKSKLKGQNYKPLYSVILTPTRELAVQVKNHIVAAAKYTGINVAAIFGGLSVEKQERLLKRCPEIVVATPGRFWELYQQENAHLIKVEDISFLVIDETDRMVEKGHFEELRNLLKILNLDESKKKSRQNFVFSATLTLVHDLPEHLKKRNHGRRLKFVKTTPGLKVQNLIEELGLSQPKVVDITRSQQTAESLMECRLMCSIDQKDYYLYYFIQQHPGRTIVFCNSIECVKRLATLFGLLLCNPLPLHANMIQKQRLKNLERFRDNPNGLLIATDVAARGLDIPNVDHVIHYQVPRTSENYVHRSGRTARAQKDGITVMFIEPTEVKSYLKLCKTLDRSEDMPLFPISEKFLSVVKESVNLARDVDKEELKLRRTQTEIGWMKKTAHEMDIIIDGYNEESGSDDDEDPFIIERRRNRLRLETLRAKLKTILAQPIFPKGFSFKYPSLNEDSQALDLGFSNNGNEKSARKVLHESIEKNKLEKKLRNKKRHHS